MINRGTLIISIRGFINRNGLQLPRVHMRVPYVCMVYAFRARMRTFRAMRSNFGIHREHRDGKRRREKVPRIRPKKEKGKKKKRSTAMIRVAFHFRGVLPCFVSSKPDLNQLMRPLLIALGRRRAISRKFNLLRRYLVGRALFCFREASRGFSFSWDNNCKKEKL